MHFEFADLLRTLVQGPIPESVPPLCDCGAPVRRHRELCADCLLRQRRADRSLLLAHARASLPTMPWARCGGGWEPTADPQILDAVAHWTREKGNLVLLGRTGCGKTTAVVARIRGMLDRAERELDAQAFRWAAGIRFAVAADLALSRKRWSLGNGEAPEVEDAMRATLLVLDELGFEPQWDTAIPEVVDLRYRRGLLTIATSGCTSEKLSARYGEATVRKLVAGGRQIDAFGGAA